MENWFDDLVDGGSYRARTHINESTKRFQVDDTVLEMESSLDHLDSLRPLFNKVHLYQNVKVLPDQREKATLWPSLTPSYMETFQKPLNTAQSKVHPSDVDLTLARVDLFEGFLESFSSLFCTTGYKHAPKRTQFNQLRQSYLAWLEDTSHKL